MPFCKNCGTKFEDGAKFCPDCGTPIGTTQKVKQKKSEERIQYKCPNCGAILSKEDTKCSECGYVIGYKKNNTAVKKLVSLIDTAETKWDVFEIVSEFDFPLDAQEMLELAIFASEKIGNPYCDSDYDKKRSLQESKSWVDLIKKIETKVLHISKNKDIVEKITNIRIEAEKSYKQYQTSTKKLKTIEMKIIKYFIKAFIAWIVLSIISVIVYYKLIK